jgi:hypothetical protein
MEVGWFLVWLEPGGKRIAVGFDMRVLKKSETCRFRVELLIQSRIKQDAISGDMNVKAKVTNGTVASLGRRE